MPLKAYGASGGAGSGSSAAADGSGDQAVGAEDHISGYPRLNPRDEESEWLNTPPVEIAEIQSDLHGLHVSSPPPPPPPPPPSVAAAIAAEDSFRAEAETSAAATLLTGDGSRAGSPGGTPWLQDPTAKAAALAALDAEMNLLPLDKKEAFVEATRKCPEFVDSDHRMGFLWREEYDAKLAAHRMASCWQYKRRLFGPEKTYLPMSLCGAMRDDTVSLSRGFLSLLPERDQHGRAMLFCDVGKYVRSREMRDSMTRVYWYLCHVASEDPIAHERGIVFLTFPKNISLLNTDPDMMRTFSDLEMKCLSIRIRSLHLCHPPLMFHISHPIMKLTLSSRMRKRLKVHVGTQEEVLVKLAGYGLTRDRMPSALGGESRLDPVRWLSDRMMQEGLRGWGMIPALPSPVFLPPPLLLAQQQAGLPEEVGVGPLAGTNGFVSVSAQPNKVEEAMAAKRRMNRLLRQITPQITPRNGAVLPQDPHSGHLNQPLKEPLSVVPSPATISPNVRKSTAERSSPQRERPPRGRRASVKRGDPRMNRSVEVRLANPHMSLFDALMAGGFDFPTVAPGAQKELSDQKTKDADGVSLYQRKNQLNRRLREARRGDQRMTRAVAAKVEEPCLSMSDALLRGGFEFPLLGRVGFCDRLIRDTDNISLYSRKTEMFNRLVHLPVTQLQHIVACSSGEDRSYMNTLNKKVSAPLPAGGNVNQAIAHALASGAGEVVQQSSSMACAQGKESQPVEGQVEYNSVANVSSSPSEALAVEDSFMRSILELPSISEMSTSNHDNDGNGSGDTDELIIGTWLWNSEAVSLPHADRIESNSGISFC